MGMMNEQRKINEEKLINFYNLEAKTHENGLLCWNARHKINDMEPYLEHMRPLSKYFNQGSKTLVAGCTIGYQVYALKELGFDAHGCDISQYAIDNAITTNCICCNITKTPYADKEFNNVLATDIMEHLPEEWLDDALKEIARITKDKFLARIPFDPKEQPWLYKIEDTLSEHMINQREEWWQERMGKYFEGWKHTFWLHPGEPQVWRYYLYERI
jgi:ubiquinone/menaquinone biosynthesis C-methylase UbiE